VFPLSGAPLETSQGVATLTAGTAVPITVEFSIGSSISGSVLHFGWQPPDPTLGAAAVAAASAADVAIVFANDVTGEGMDRPSLGLPGDQDQLISAVAAANPRTVVVLHTAGPFLMPWLPQVAAVLEAWYPGQETGNAIAAVPLTSVDINHQACRVSELAREHVWTGGHGQRCARVGYPGHRPVRLPFGRVGGSGAIHSQRSTVPPSSV